MEGTFLGMNEAEIAQWGMTVGVSGFIAYMVFIVFNLSLEAKAGKFGTFILFLVLTLGMLGFVVKSVLQWMWEG
jgi:hypothetical protein